MIQIYHNPRCAKSREALALLEKSGLPYQVVNYLKNPLSNEALTELITKLGIAPHDLIRKNEALWKASFRDKNLGPEALVALMVENPRLIERPILECGKHAVIGRPIAQAEEFIKRNS